jgi:cytochrome c-type biogenesis protein
MVRESPGFFLALAMGMVSFLTPCVLPLVPAYISFISGHSLSELKAENKSGKLTASVLFAAVCFVLGFSVVFVLMGAAAGGIGHLLVNVRPILIRVAGLVIIVFGLQLAGVFKLMPLLREKRYQGEIKAAGPVKAFLFGLAFAFGWSPCIGPILGSILVIAANQDTMFKGIALLAAYSLGMAVPFLLTAVLVEQFLKFSNKVKPYFRAIEIGAGAILVAVGVLMVINRFEILKAFFLKILPQQISGMG